MGREADQRMMAAAAAADAAAVAAAGARAKATISADAVNARAKERLTGMCLAIESSSTWSMCQDLLTLQWN